jgi:succinyl-diaminopimelate desuccinylase
MSAHSDLLRASLDTSHVTERLATLVRCPSENPPGNEKEVAGIVADMCSDLGLEVSSHEAEPGRPSVVARWTQGDGPTLTYCTHSDVVPVGDPGLWDRDPFGAEVEGGRMHGRGTSDAKGPLAAALEAVGLLKAAGARFAGTLELALVADEETMGFKGAAYLVDEQIIRPDVAIVGEPTSLRVVRAQRGAAWYRIATRGVAGHGSTPEKGLSAIKHMAEIVLRLEETLPDVHHDLLGGPTISVGTIRGGEKVNIIPASCLIEVDRRTVPGETEDSVSETIAAAVELAGKRFPDIDATIELAFSARPFEIPPDARLVTEALEAVGEARGGDAEVMGFRGASDARFIADTGADVIVCGPGQIELAHTARESIDLVELGDGTLAYALLFSRMLSASLEGET